MKTDSSKIPADVWARLPWHKRKWILLRVVWAAFFFRFERRRSTQRVRYINDRRNRSLRPADLLPSVMVSEIIIFAEAGQTSQPVYVFAVAQILLAALVMLPTILIRRKHFID